MATTFADLHSLVYAALGKDSSDPTAALIVPHAVNNALIAVAALFEPIDLDTSKQITVAAKVGFVSLTTLNYITIDSVVLSAYGGSRHGREILPLPMAFWRSLGPAPRALDPQGVPKYYVVGNDKTLFLQPCNELEVALGIAYLELPTLSTNYTDEISYSNLDAEVVALASKYSFALFEEGESANIWQSIADTFGTPALKIQQLKTLSALSNRNPVMTQAGGKS